MADTPTQTSEKIIATPITNIYGLAEGDLLAVFDNSSGEITYDASAGEATRPPMKLVAWLAIAMHHKGITGVDRAGSYDSSHYEGYLHFEGDPEATYVWITNGGYGLDTFAPNVDDETRRRCKLRGWHVVAKLSEPGGDDVATT